MLILLKMVDYNDTNHHLKTHRLNVLIDLMNFKCFINENIYRKKKVYILVGSVAE